jgi:hypothetical protein
MYWSEYTIPSKVPPKIVYPPSDSWTNAKRCSNAFQAVRRAPSRSLLNVTVGADPPRRKQIHVWKCFPISLLISLSRRYQNKSRDWIFSSEFERKTLWFSALVYFSLIFQGPLLIVTILMTQENWDYKSR